MNLKEIIEEKISNEKIKRKELMIVFIIRALELKSSKEYALAIYNKAVEFSNKEVRNEERRPMDRGTLQELYNLSTT